MHKIPTRKKSFGELRLLTLILGGRMFGRKYKVHCRGYCTAKRARMHGPHYRCHYEAYILFHSSLNQSISALKIFSLKENKLVKLHADFWAYAFAK